MKVLITGGCGFVGSAIARHFANEGTHTVVAFDNLRRRGSERNVADLAARGVAFVHGDVRNTADLDAIEGRFDVLIEASAEPSVHAGIGGSPRYVIDTNLVGAANCLEFARERCGAVVFLSTSRVYSIEPLAALPLLAGSDRLQLETNCALQGVSAAGISEDFATGTQRSYYGASKLAAELLCQEYAAHARLPVIIDRCGVIAGPGQFGKTDQGVFTLWVARHHFGGALKYTGFGGTGLQVRDLLHPDDLCDLLALQIASCDALSGTPFNVGGGLTGSVSLREYTRLCEAATGRSLAIAQDATTSPVDIPWYVSDHGRLTARLGWAPRRTPQTIVHDIAAWVRENESSLSTLFA
jgi:CDP-paratose 2-epimerase